MRYGDKAKERTVRVSCEVSLEGESMDSRSAQVFEKALARVCEEVFPHLRIAGLWVHESAT